MTRSYGVLYTALFASLLVSQQPALSAAETDPHTSERGTGDSTDDESLEAAVDKLDEDIDGRTEEEASDANSDDESKESDSLEELKREVARASGDGSDQGQNAMNPEISAILDTGAAWHSDEPVMNGGPDPSSFGPFLQSVELALNADVDPFFTFEGHLVAGLSGLKVGEAFGRTLALPAGFQARFGKFKTRFGRVNPLHLHAWTFTALPLVNGKFLGPAGLNGLGLEVSQILPLPWYAEWVFAVQDLASPKTGHAFLRNPDALGGPMDLVPSARLEQFFELSNDWDLLWGLNAAVGRNDSGGVDRRRDFLSRIYGLDLFLKFKPAARGGRSELGWQTEVMARQRDAPDGDLTDLGGYSYVYWAPNRTWEFGTRYEYVTGPLDADSDYLHGDGRENRQRAGVGLTFLPSNFSRFRLEYMAGDRGGGVEDLAHSVILKAQLVTGAHGAHTY